MQAAATKVENVYAGSLWRLKFETGEKASFMAANTLTAKRCLIVSAMLKLVLIKFKSHSR